MFPLRCRASVASAAVVVSRAAILGLALAAAGCASSHGARETAQAYAHSNHARETDAPEVEDDGLPSQTPPLHRRSAEPDDPTQPYSRNYGTTLPRRSADAGRYAAPGPVPPPAGLGRVASRGAD